MKKENTGMWQRILKIGMLSIILLYWTDSLYAIETSENMQSTTMSVSGETVNFKMEGITVEAKRPDWESKLSPGTVTVIRPDDYKGEQKDLPDFLKMVPGVHVREINGKGQYTTVSVRGSTAAQVGVFVDGVLFNLGGDAAADISTIPVHNVERIEVYRGYIPARFGGTFMGGVINIVTKKTNRGNVTASVGRSSFGGKKANLQFDLPLGSGTLMIGINHDESKGNFKYKNFSYDRDKEYREEVENAKSRERNAIDNYNRAFKELKEYDFTDSDGNIFKADTLEEATQIVKNNQDRWENSLQEAKNDIDNNFLVNLEDFPIFPGIEKENILPFLRSTHIDAQQALYDSIYKEYTVNQGNTILPKWKDSSGNWVVPDKVEDFIEAYNKRYKTEYQHFQQILTWNDGNIEDIERWIGSYGDSEAVGYAQQAEYSVKEMEKHKKQAEAVKDHYRRRKANDYKNMDIILKWQDEHWMAKATWKRIKRHLPFPIDMNYGYTPYIDTDLMATNPLSIFYHRNQKLTVQEFLFGRRDTFRNLEWGWSVNYLKQEKDYYVDDWEWLEKNTGSLLNSYRPNTLWSKYDSHRWGAKLDGSYKAGERHIIEFMVNASKEKMDIDGWRMKDFSSHSSDTRARWRNYYEQDIFNAQLQDTITLNRKGDLWLTPSIRYNRSTILGRSERYDKKKDPQKWKFFSREDKQTDDKVTWQVAIKKQFNEHFTLRATGGSYYRLLNMYEIAGDGAGIIPMPNIKGDGSIEEGGKTHVFPMPEEGKQWDVSAIWDGAALGAKAAKLQLTYFGRDSKRILELGSWNRFFFVYTNAISAKVHGAEIQADLSWKKWDLNLQATYTRPRNVVYDRSALPEAIFWNGGVFKGFLTYQPKWEGTARITYRPNPRWSIFSQFRYVGEMITSRIPLATGDFMVQSSLTAWDLGIKCKLTEHFQIALGVNDLFNKANDMYHKYKSINYQTNIQYPIQGRSYYASFQYKF
ncbi:MAG: TonB-dependent receptor plug domain-containing protein [Fusobacterium necrophorum]|nr:TonB-dependent receptor plug domain-containing protein [Fusobacterium necrophorum]